MLFKVFVVERPNSVVDVLTLEMSPSPHPPSLLSAPLFLSLDLAPWMSIVGIGFRVCYGSHT
jgi:hypothetical protein